MYNEMLDVFQDKMVGLSLCNGKQAAYVPVEHISAVYRTKIPGQIKPDDLRKVFKNNIFNEKFKWVYHNAKFDLPVLYNFLGFQMPAPYWDTLIVAYVLDQNEDHGLKALYNKYIAEEDEGVNRFLIKSSYIVIYRKINKVNQFIIGCITLKSYANGEA